MDEPKIIKVDIPYQTFTDFITQGVIHLVGDHMYIHFRNDITFKKYVFHLPKILFDLMIEKTIITENMVEWEENIKNTEDDKKQKENDSTQRMYG